MAMFHRVVLPLLLLVAACPLLAVAAPGATAPALPPGPVSDVLNFEPELSSFDYLPPEQQQTMKRKAEGYRQRLDTLQDDRLALTARAILDYYTLTEPEMPPPDAPVSLANLYGEPRLAAYAALCRLKRGRSGRLDPNAQLQVLSEMKIVVDAGAATGWETLLLQAAEGYLQAGRPLLALEFLEQFLRFGTPEPDFNRRLEPFLISTRLHR